MGIVLEAIQQQFRAGADWVSEEKCEIGQPRPVSGKTEPLLVNPVRFYARRCRPFQRQKRPKARVQQAETKRLDEDGSGRSCMLAI